ncbi:MAG: hypothetical protein V4582_16510 [Pseudomonadota bacterium]
MMNRQEFERAEAALEQEISRLQVARRSELNYTSVEYEQQTKERWSNIIRNANSELDRLKNRYYAQPESAREPRRAITDPNELLRIAQNTPGYQAEVKRLEEERMKRTTPERKLETERAYQIDMKMRKILNYWK